MAILLKKSVRLAAIFIATILTVVLILGARQYNLRQEYRRIITQSEQLLFQYAAIREHIIESLLDDRPEQLDAIAREMESLHTNIGTALDNPHIPDQFKLSFANQVDLPGIILLLRQVASGHPDSAKLRQLNRETRILGERLMLFDRVIVNYVKTRVMDFQNMTIGALAIVIFLITAILLTGHRYLSVPLLELTRQVGMAIAGNREKIALTQQPASGDLIALAETFNDMYQCRRRDLADLTRCHRILFATQRAGMAAQRAKSRAELFEAMARALLFNESYCLVWIGAPDGNRGLTRVVADGPAASGDAMGGECLALLLAGNREEKKAESEPAIRAHLSGKPVVERDLLAGIPTGRLKDTSLANGRIDCAALPLYWQQNRYGAICIYSTDPHGFDDHEMKLLAKMTDDAAFALFFLETGHYNSRLSTLGELTTGVAREINDLNNGIINYTQLLEDEIGEPTLSPRQKALFANIFREGDRVAGIVRQILAFDQKDDEAREYVAPGEAVNSALALIAPQLRGDGIGIRLEIPPDLPALHVNVPRLHQVLLNLLTNARQALNRRYEGRHDNKRIDIGVESGTGAPSGCLRLLLTDYGTGIEEAIMPKIFDPAFSSRTDNRGAGMGLTVSRILIEEMGGKLTVASVYGDHTTATIELPAG